MSEPGEKLTYATYLKVPDLLGCQQLESEKEGNKQHDEHLFIIIHQVYELWFKQILVELDTVPELLKKAKWDGTGSDCFLVVNRLNRVTLILRLVADQFPILETMTPMDFLEFRSYLKTGSGFQSHQFRKLENKLGIKDVLRVEYSMNYRDCFEKTEHDELDEAKEKSLLAAVQSWLERIPEIEDGSFKKKFDEAVDEMLKDKDGKAEERDTFNGFTDKKEHEQLLEQGKRRFSHKALYGALQVFLYRDEPRFQQPYRLLTLLMDIDSLMMRWRSNHVSMVHRMIGGKAGTGGSSGKEYLESTFSDKYKAFLDLFNLPTFLLTREHMPKL